MRGTGISLNNDFDVAVQPARGADGKLIGGVQIMETLPQNQAVILAVHAGELKELPTMGVGISDMLLDSNWLNWRRKILMQMQLDEQVVNGITLVNGKMNINANYAN